MSLLRRMTRGLGVLRARSVARMLSGESAAVADHFGVLGVQRRFDLDDGELSSRFKALQAEWHPDRHVSSSFASSEVEAISARINVAYDVLRHAHRRAAHLLELLSAEANSESDADSPATATAAATAVDDNSFLVSIVDLREDIEDAIRTRDQQRLDDLKQTVERRRQACVDDTARAFAENNLADMKRYTNRLQYYASIKQVFDNL